MRDIKNNFLKNVSLVISVLFHPIILTTYFYCILVFSKNFFAYAISSDYKLNFILYIFIGTFVFPAFFVLILKKRGVISSISINEQSERTFPLIMGITMYIIIYIMLRKISLTAYYTNFPLACGIIISFCLCINYFWKISIHSAGIGGLTAAIVYLGVRFNLNYFFIIVVLFIISALVIQARLYIKAHNIKQVFAGYLLGFITMTITYALTK